MTELEVIKASLNKLTQKTDTIGSDIEDIKDVLANIQSQVLFIMNQVQNLG